MRGAERRAERAVNCSRSGEVRSSPRAGCPYGGHAHQRGGLQFHPRPNGEVDSPQTESKEERNERLIVQVEEL